MIAFRCWISQLATSTPPWRGLRLSWLFASCRLGLCMAGSCSRWTLAKAMFFSFFGGNLAPIFIAVAAGEKGPRGWTRLSREEQRGEKQSKKNGAGARQGQEGPEGGGSPSWGRPEDQGKLKLMIPLSVINEKGGFLGKFCLFLPLSSSCWMLS